MIGQKVIRGLWLGLAVTFPLFAVEFLRYENEHLRIHIAIPMFILGAITIIVYLTIIFNGGIVRMPLLTARYLKLLFILGILFLLWNIIASLDAVYHLLAVREVAKVLLGLSTMFVVAIFFPHDEEFLKCFWRLVIFSSAVLAAFLIYRYAFIFKTPYLGSYLDSASRAGKNHLMSYFAYVFPYAFFYFWKGRRMTRILPLVILTIAWLYGGSRGAWVAISLGLIALIPLVGRSRSLGKGRAFIAMVAGIGLLVLIGGAILERVVNFEPLEYKRRLQYVYDPVNVPELHSYESRKDSLIEAWRIFLTSPIRGSGLTNVEYALTKEGPHNDYFTILAELGIVGAGIFLGILSIVWSALRYRCTNSSWVSLGTRSALVSIMVFMLTMDRIYTTTLFWAFLGLALVTSDIEKRSIGLIEARR